VVLTPLLAFTREGGRLGWGQGHFDRTLASSGAPAR
jgi:5-formyltetrahydrofolate cyclo-ligase